MREIINRQLQLGEQDIGAIDEDRKLTRMGRDIAAFQVAAAELGVPLTVIPDSFAGGREQMEARMTLVRPDQFVAWTGDSAGRDVNAVLARAAGLD